MLHTLYIPTSDHTPRLTLGEKEVVRWIAGILLAFYRCYIRAVRWQLKGGGSVRKAFLWALCWQQEERNTENVSEQVQSQKMQSFPACTHSSYSAFTYEVVFILQETWKQICLLFINPLILSGRLALVQKFVSFHFTQGPPSSQGRSRSTNPKVFGCSHEIFAIRYLCPTVGTEQPFKSFCKTYELLQRALEI